MPEDRRDKGRPRESSGDLSPADRALWRRITEGTRPLDGRRVAPAPEDAEEVASPRPASRPPLPRAEPVTLAPPRPRPPELAPGSAAGVARRQLERLRRGRLPIEARLDLHGHTQEQAHRELCAFLARAQERGLRCVLVVTGKGLARSDGGVLRRTVPQWLNQPPNRGRVLAFDQAQPKDGGMGAFYVLLKRRRA